MAPPHTIRRTRPAKSRPTYSFGEVQASSDRPGSEFGQWMSRGHGGLARGRQADDRAGTGMERSRIKELCDGEVE